MGSCRRLQLLSTGSGGLIKYTTFCTQRGKQLPQIIFSFSFGDCRRHSRMQGSEVKGEKTKKVWDDATSEMCVSPVIFRWKQNCKRQTRISLCLSLADRNRVRSLAGVQADLVALWKYLPLGGSVDHCTSCTDTVNPGGSF